MADAETDAKPVDQDTLVADIDRTRAELARTIDAIADRVNPRKNIDLVRDEVRRQISQVDLRIAGGAAVAVVVTATLFIVWRRRKR
jgi:Protein of unknown function (DUF3618)